MKFSSILFNSTVILFLSEVEPICLLAIKGDSDIAIILIFSSTNSFFFVNTFTVYEIEAAVFELLKSIGLNEAFKFVPFFSIKTFALFLITLYSKSHLSQKHSYI